MEISAENTTSDDKQRQWHQKKMKVKGQKLGTVTSFEYLRAVVLDDGFIPEALSRIAQATYALTKLKPILTDSNYLLDHR